MGDSSPLTTEQRYALLDILTHDRTYREIEQFKSPSAIHNYGPPFQDDIQPSTPILQSLVTKCALTLPGLRDVSPDFWKVHVQSLITDLAAADLSESYDKGNLGIRKTLATALSSLLEYPVRGMLGAFPKDDSAFQDRDYSPSSPDDVLLAWQHFLQRIVYTDYLDHLYQKASETNQLSDHDSLTQSAHEFIVVNLASFMHYTLVLSPEGSSLVRLIDNVNKLAPYILIRQTLRVGNVATMINGMLKLVLAKVSIGSLTNWIGLSSGADEGTNLLQQIISQILGWDKRDLKKRLDKIDKDKDGPSKEVKDALKHWVSGQDQEEHLRTRDMSRQNGMSMVQTILALSSTSPEMSEAQHARALQYLALQLSIRDRDQLVQVLCKSQPDHLTQGIKDGVAAYEPMIRQLHQAVDLSGTVSDFQAFVHDMLKVCKHSKAGSRDGATLPSVEDFVHLLHRHQLSSHKFLHQVAKNAPHITEWFREWCHSTVSMFKQDKATTADKVEVSDELASSFANLSPEEQTQIKGELDAHSLYLKEIHDDSAARIRKVVQDVALSQRDTSASGSSTPKSGSISPSADRTLYGPGAYLAKWQDLLDSTEIQPDKPFGPLRSGADVSVRAGNDQLDDDNDDDTQTTALEAEEKQRLAKVAQPPKTEITLRTLGPRFDAALKGER